MANKRFVCLILDFSLLNPGIPASSRASVAGILCVGLGRAGLSEEEASEGLGRGLRYGWALLRCFLPAGMLSVFALDNGGR